MQRLKNMCGALLLLLTSVGSLLAGEPVPDRLNLEHLLLEHTKIMAGQLTGAGARYIGVLRFLARHENAKSFSNSMGRLHQRLAEKAELSLVFAGSGRPPLPIVAIRSANETASRIPGANHLNLKDERSLELLFQQQYQLAWKADDIQYVQPDAFIYGVAELADNLQTIDLQLSAVLRPGLSFQAGTNQRRVTGNRFTARLDLDELMSAGESYCIAASDIDSEGQQAAYQSARASREDVRHHPLRDPSRPIDIEVWYGNRLTPIDFRSPDRNHVGAYITEPDENQVVKLVIKRRNPSDTKRYGVLLRVNGLNTIGKENLPDGQCSIWILEPDMHIMQVDGFQITQGSAGMREPFRVAARSEAKALEDLYGQDVGLISVAVFHESNDSTDLLEEEATAHKYTQLYAIKKLALPKQTADSRSSLGANLTDQLYQQFEKGIISHDSKAISKPTRLVSFRRAPVPIFATSIRYYNQAK